MPDNYEIHHRSSIRLKGYDYPQAGLYFITQNRECLFGEIRCGDGCSSGFLKPAIATLEIDSLQFSIHLCRITKFIYICKIIPNRKMV
jgi:hypothetical protein